MNLSDRALHAAWVTIAHATQELWQRQKEGKADKNDLRDYDALVEARDALNELRIKAGMAPPIPQDDAEARREFERIMQGRTATTVCRDCWVAGFKHGRNYAAR
jgi:hypothetical protein